MKIAEIKEHLTSLYTQYSKESKELTSVQLPVFKTRFEKKNRVKITTGWGLTIELLPPVIVDDFSEVKDVTYARTKVGFWTEKEKDYPCICLEDFSFCSKSKSSMNLRKGEKIRFWGEVHAQINNYEYISINIRPKSSFSIKFSKN